MKADQTTEAQVEGGAVDTNAASGEEGQQGQDQQQADQPGADQQAQAAEEQQQAAAQAQQGQQSGEQGNGSDAQQQSAPAVQEQQQAAPTEQEMEDRFRAKMLKELNVEKWEDLQQKLNPSAPETPEQIKRREDVKRAAIQAYAVSNLEMTPEQFVRMENVKGMTDEALVYDAWEQEWMAENKDNPEFVGKDLKTEARYEFEEQFHINSENARAKKNGEGIIAKTAKQIRAAYENDFKTAESEYDNSQGYHSNLALFKTAVQSSLSALPTERTFKISDTENVTYALDKLDKVQLEKFLVNNANFNYFMEKGGQEAAAYLNGEINKYIKLNHHEDMVNAAIITARAVGLKEGSVGAKAPFQETSVKQQHNQTPDDLTPEERAKLRRTVGGGGFFGR